MGVDLYYMRASAPCRAVMLTAKALDLPLNLKITNPLEGDQLKPEFIKLNPQHCIPTLVDGDLVLWESRAIIAYLASAYGKGNTTLYPSEPKARALVDQRMYFDIGTLYARFGEYFYPQAFGGAPADPAKLAKLDEALKLLDTFLEGQKYAAGNNLTIADLTLIATVSTMEAIKIDFKKYPNVNRWYQLVKTTAPGYKEANQDGVDDLIAIVAQAKKP